MPPAMVPAVHVVALWHIIAMWKPAFRLSILRNIYYALTISTLFPDRPSFHWSNHIPDLKNYLLFICRANPGLDNRAISRLLGKEWGELPTEEKLPYR